MDHRSDIYSLGAILYELLTGDKLFEQYSGEALIKAHCSLLPSSLLKRRPTLNKSLNDLVLQMLAKAPEERPDDYEDLIEKLEEEYQNVAVDKVDEILREFDGPAANLTLKTRPPSEVDISLLEGYDTERRKARLVDEKKKPPFSEETVQIGSTHNEMFNFAEFENERNGKHKNMLWIVAFAVLLLLVIGGALLILIR